MKILIDIGHPAHVHYFRNFIKEMENKGHSFLVIAKDQNVTYELLKHYDIPFIKRRKYPKSMYGKFLQIPFTDYFILRKSLEYKPDLLIGFSGTHISHVGWILNIPSFVFDDTEHAKFAHASYKFFAKHIVTPSWFNKDMGSKQIRFDSYMELCALHPKYFKPNPKIFSDLGLLENDEYIILRFISWSASHDIGQYGFTLEMKYRLINQFKNKYKIFISSEGDLPDDLLQYKIEIPAFKLHDALNYAKLYIGEGSTTACEAAILGTPAIYCNSLKVGNCQEIEEKYDLCFSILDIDTIISKANEILNNSNNKIFFQNNKNQLINDKINTTDFMIWLVENYPKSIAILQKEKNYKFNFQ